MDVLRRLRRKEANATHINQHGLEATTRLSPAHPRLIRVLAEQAVQKFLLSRNRDPEDGVMSRIQRPGSGESKEIRHPGKRFH